MASNSNRGSGSGRPALDWEQAFAYYAALPPSERTYAAVAKQFGVSARTVERHGREEHWQQRLGEIKAEVAASTNTTIAQNRVEQALKTIRLIDATLIGYADKLRRGEMRMVPGDLEKLSRLSEQLMSELAAPAATTSAPAAVTSAPRSAEHLAAVLEALAESGALEALGLQQIATLPKRKAVN
jgi:hypothetical protein